ncbi:AIR synthase related protein [Candidatus Altiarchaeota archaeon]
MEDNVIGKYVEGIAWVRDELLAMDGLADPIMGIGSWDDAVCISHDGTLLASMDGPYDKRLVLKSALIHAATDVVVKGARPVFALDSVAGPEVDVRQMIDSLKAQALAMELPILGGNTRIEDVKPTATVCVVGTLIIAEPIRDSGAGPGDRVCLLGEPLWGAQDERIGKAKILFSAWYRALEEGIVINSSKDVTKGGITGVVHEMQEKSGRMFELGEPTHSLTRNLDNFLITLAEGECVRLKAISEDMGCPLEVIGVVK